MNAVDFPGARLTAWSGVLLFSLICVAQGAMIVEPDSLLIWAGASARAERTGESPPAVSDTHQTTNYADGGQTADASVQAGNDAEAVTSHGHGQTDVLGRGVLYLLVSGEGTSDSSANTSNYAVFAETSGGGEFRITYQQPFPTKFALQLDYDAQTSGGALFSETGTAFRLWMTFATNSYYWYTASQGAQRYDIVGYIPQGQNVDIHVIADASTKLFLASGQVHASFHYTLNLNLKPLDMACLSDGVQLSWPPIDGYRVEGYTGPLGFGSWGLLDLTPTIVDGLNVVKIPYDSQHVHFYR